MNRRALLLPICLFALLVGALEAPMAQEPEPAVEIRDLSVSNRQGTIAASFRVEGPFTSRNQEKLAGAHTIRFIHTLKLVRRRTLWFSRVLAERRVEVTARYDNLTRQYFLSRDVDGWQGEESVTDSEDEMRRYMTEIEDLEVASAADLRGERRVTLRVKTEYQDTWLLFLFPWSYSASAEMEVVIAR
jgi:hypothetical protein